MPADSVPLAETPATRSCHPVARSRVTNGSALLPGVDGRSCWARRCRDIIAAHLSDIPDASAAERSIIRRASVMTVELERLEREFALAGEADPETLDLYGRVAGNLRRLLEAVGLERRSLDVNDGRTPLQRHLARIKQIEQQAQPQGNGAAP